MSFKILKSLGLFSLISIVATLLSCGSDDQFTNKLVAQPFVSKLFGQTTKTIALSTNEGDQIAWMGLEWSGDFKFFQIERVNGTAPKTISSTTVFNDISVSTNPFDKKEDGMLVSGPLSIAITYKPLTAILSEERPHKAYLLIAYEKPNLGVVRIELQGLTKGINVSKCTRSASSMDTTTYSLKTGSLQLYLCDADVIEGAQVTGKSPSGKENVNLKDIPVEGKFTFYQPDNETVCILSGSTDREPTIPDFDIPVPEGIKGVPANTILPVKLPTGSFAECSLDDSGNLLCDKSITLDVFNNAIPVTPLILTNGSIQPVSDDCPNFGEISGDKTFGGDMKLVTWGVVTSNGKESLTAQFNIDGALIVAILDLVKE